MILNRLRVLFCHQIQRPFHNHKSTERETNSFILNLFSGRIQTSDVFPYPASLTPEEIEHVSRLGLEFEDYLQRNFDSSKYEKTRKVPEEILEELFKMGMFSMLLPKKYKGLNLKFAQTVHLLEVIGAADLGLSAMICAHQFTGVGAIHFFGSEKLKEKYLKKIGPSNFAAIGFYELDSGFLNPENMSTEAVLSPGNNHYILNGDKFAVINGYNANFFTVIAKTKLEHDTKFTAFVVDKNAEGLNVDKPLDRTGLVTVAVTNIHFKDVKIPMENVIGKIGDGLEIAEIIYTMSRLMTGATLCGTMKYCINLAIHLLSARYGEGYLGKDFDSVKDSVARLFTLQYINEAIAYAIAANMDVDGPHFPIEAMLLRIHSSDSATKMVEFVIQLIGGFGFARYSKLERIMKDLLFFKLIDGKNEVLRDKVVRYGLDFVKNFKLMDETDQRATLINKITKSFGVTFPPNLDHIVHPEFLEASRLISKAIDQFAFCVETILVPHDEYVSRQYILNRVAMCIYLIYASMIILSRGTKSLYSGLPTAELESYMVKTYCFDAYHKIMYNINFMEQEIRLMETNLMQETARFLFSTGRVPFNQPFG